MSDREVNESGLIPINNRVVIRPDEVSDTTGESGLIWVPQLARERQQDQQTIGTIIAIGPNAFEADDPPRPEVGDKILYKRYSGFSSQHPETRVKYEAIKDGDIIGILTI